MLGDLLPDAGLVVHMHMVQRGLRVHRQLPFRPDNLGGILLAGSHHARSVKVRDLAVVELHQADRVVAVVVLAQVRLDGGDAHGGHGLDLAVLAEEPEREVDVVDRAVDEDPAGELRVRDEEAGRVELVAGLAAHHGRRADRPGLHFAEGVAVGGVEAPREPAHYL